MQSFTELNENFKFLVLEIRKQVEETVRAFEDPENFSMSRLKKSADYADNLRNLIFRRSYSRILNAGETEKKVIDYMMALTTISANLERIGDFCENIVKQVDHFTDPAFFRRYNYNRYFREIFSALDHIEDAHFKQDVEIALEIARAEIELDRMYKEDFDAILLDLKKAEENAGDLLTSLFIFRYLERIGDSLLNMGEAIISCTVGTKLKISQYIALRESVTDEDFRLEDIGENTRSGCIIEKISWRGEGHGWSEVIFKEGKSKKLEEERKRLQQWEKLIPGIAPRVLEYTGQGENASILMEYLRGKNFQEILVGQDDVLFVQSLRRIIETIRMIWDITLSEETCSAKFIEQLQKRLPDILNVHPEFALPCEKFGARLTPSLQEMITALQRLEENNPAPFSVFIHGDFNNDNILYDEERDQIHFIDLHRSRYTDYLQDASVFLVSNFRIPIFEEKLRTRLNRVNSLYFQFLREFSVRRRDDGFHLRLAFGLIRSLITSTRFALNNDFSREMFHRAVYLIRKVLSTDPLEFRINEDIILY